MTDALLIALGYLAVACTVGTIITAAIAIPCVIHSIWTPIWRTPSTRAT